MRFRPILASPQRTAATIAAAAAGIVVIAPAAPAPAAGPPLAVVSAAAAPSSSRTPFPACAPNQAAPKLLTSTKASIEGAVVDRSGRLYVTDLFNGRLLRFDTPSSPARVIASIAGGGGGALALENDGTVIVGGGADPRVFLGDTLKPGNISRLDAATGKLTPFSKGYSAANGLAVAKDGTIYATNDFGNLIGRRLPDGTVQSSWAKFPSANGAVLSSDDKYLYVSRTFVNAGVSRIPLATPTKPESLLTFQGLDATAAPDGLTLDSQDRPIVPTDVLGDVLRIDAPGKACKIASGLGSSSVIVYGKGTTGFATGHLYRAGFDGKIYEIPGGFDPGAASH